MHISVEENMPPDYIQIGGNGDSGGLGAMILPAYTHSDTLLIYHYQDVETPFVVKVGRGDRGMTFIEFKFRINRHGT